MDKAILARVEKQAWFHWHPRGWPLLLFLIGMIGTAVSVLAVQRSENQRARVELDRDLTEVASALQWRLAENTALLRAGAALFSTQGNVTNQQFISFAADLHANGNYFGSLGLGWAPRIGTADIPAYEDAVRRAGRKGFTMFPRPGAGVSEAAPITYLEPMSAENRGVIGFDLLSEPVRRSAIEEATRTGRPIASGRVHLVQDKSIRDAAGFLLFLPVYEGFGQRQVKGYVYSPFRARDFLDSVVKLSRDRQVEVAIYDGAPTPENLLAIRRYPGDEGAALTRAIPVGGREWTMRVSTKNRSMFSDVARATLVFGIILSVLVMLFGRVMTKRASEDRYVLEWFSRQAAIRDSLTRELNHRVKNTLANVLSIVALTRRQASDLDDFAENLTARIRALGATHDLLSQRNWTSASLGDVVRSELAPYIQDDPGHVELFGPKIDLAPNDALSLGLAIHELATNAAKYGALNCAEGKVTISWDHAGPDRAFVFWREAGGPPVVEPTRRGFGRDLIEKIVSHELQSQVELEFRPEGVHCRLLVPVRQANEFTLRRLPDEECRQRNVETEMPNASIEGAAGPEK